MSKEVVRWEPFNEMVSLRDAVNRPFEELVHPTWRVALAI